MSRMGPIVQEILNVQFKKKLDILNVQNGTPFYRKF